MLILLSDRFHGRLPELTGAPGLLDALTNLALGHRAGAHIVSGPLRVLAELIRALSGDAQGIFRQIKARHLDLGTLRDHVTHLVVVEPEADAEVREERVGEQTRVHVPYTYFEDLGRAAPARLIAEDRDDATIYAVAAEGYVFRSPEVRGMCVALQTYGGGGQNMADALRDHARHGFTLCIADSDRRWPGAPEGGTALGLRRARRELSRDHVIDVLVLPCHELENLLPAQLVVDSLEPGDERGFRAACLKAQGLGFLGAVAPLHHLDLKSGLRFRDVRDAAPRPPEQAFLAEVFEGHRGRAPVPAGGWCDGEPECADRDACRCVLFEGLGGKVVQHVVKRVRAGLSPQKSAECFFAGTLTCAPAWVDLGRRIFSWGCAYKCARA